MSQKSIILIVVLFILIVAGMFIYANLKQAELESPTVPDANIQSETEDSPYDYINRITATQYFIDGTHTLVGEIELPTPCDLLETDFVVMESMPEQVRLDFSIINNSDTCVQIITAQRFQIEVVASEGATFSAYFEGREVSLNLIPAPEGATPDEFELFIKG